MSRKRQLYDLAEGKQTSVQLGNILLVNMPAPIIANDYTRELCVIANTELAKQYQAQQRELTSYDITANA